MILITLCDFSKILKKKFINQLKHVHVAISIGLIFGYTLNIINTTNTTISLSQRKEAFIQWPQPFVVLKHLFLRISKWAIMAPLHYPFKSNTVVIDGEEREKILTLPFDTNISNVDLKMHIFQTRIKFAVHLSKEKPYIMFIKDKKSDKQKSNDTVALFVGKDVQIRNKQLIQESDVVETMLNHYPKAQISYKDTYLDENTETRELLVSKLFKEYFGDEGTVMIEQQVINELYWVIDYYQMLKLKSACLWFLHKK